MKDVKMGDKITYTKGSTFLRGIVKSLIKIEGRSTLGIGVESPDQIENNLLHQAYLDDPTDFTSRLKVEDW